MQGKWASSQDDLGYTERFCVPEVISVFFRLVTVFLGTLWSSIKQNKAPCVFVWDNGIGLHAKQGNRSSSLGEGEVSWVFAS